MAPAIDSVTIGMMTARSWARATKKSDMMSANENAHREGAG
jgi:hypothetical protein